MTKLKPWKIGNIPQSLKLPNKITSYEEAIAEIGYSIIKEYFGVDLYFTQSLIAGGMLSPHIDYMGFITSSRYGKSWTISFPAIYLAAMESLSVSIGGGDKTKAGIIMDKINRNMKLADPIITDSLFGKDKIDKLATSMSKDKLAWYDGGNIDIFSLDERIKNSDVEGLGGVGIGGDVIIIDESSLISDDNYSVARRMIVESSSGKLVEISNPHRPNHFKRLMEDKDVFRVWTNAQTALEEGRFNDKRLAMAKRDMTSKQIKIFFDCEFPKEGESIFFKPQQYKVLPKILPDSIYGTLDPSLGESTKSSLQAIVVLGKGEDGKIYELESIVRQMTPDEAMNEIFKLPYTFKRFGIEAIQFQKYFLQNLQKKSRELGKHIPFEGITQTKDKLSRIESIEPYVSTGEILFKGNNELWNELVDYPETKKLDGLDSLEMCTRYLIKKAWKAVV